jgi:hypothetical protein
MASPRANRVVTTTSVVVAAQDQVSSELAGETVILSLRTGMYYGLDAVGARIWRLLGTATRVDDIRDKIVQQFDVELGRCEHDVLNFLDEMARRGLIEIGDGIDP